MLDSIDSRSCQLTELTSSAIVRVSLSQTLLFHRPFPTLQAGWQEHAMFCPDDVQRWISTFSHPDHFRARWVPPAKTRSQPLLHQDWKLRYTPVHHKRHARVDLA